MSPGKSRVQRWRETESARFDQYLIDSFYSGESDLTADRPVRVIYGTRRLTDELAVREPAPTADFASTSRPDADCDDSDQWVAGAARGETPILGDYPDRLAEATAEATQSHTNRFDELRNRARQAFGPRTSPNDPESSDDPADADLSTATLPGQPAERKSDDFSWMRYGLYVAAGTLAGIGMLAVFSSL